MFFAPITLWWAALSPLSRKIMMYVGLAALLLIALWWIRKDAYETGKKHGVQEGLDSAIEVTESMIKEEREKLAVQEEAIKDEWEAVRSEKAKVESLRKTIRKDLEAGLNEINTKIQSIPGSIVNIPDERIDDGIRAILEQLANPEEHPDS